MKQITLFLFFLYSIGISAQDILILSSPETIGGNKMGCKGITLQPGFSFTATADKSLSLKVDPSICDSQVEAADISSNQNYIVTITPLGQTKSVKYTNGNIVVDRTTEGDVPVQVSVQYYDGLGRPSQNVQRGITPKGNDLVTIQEYDSLGRESNLWLPTPYAANGGYTDPTAIMSKAKSLDVYSDNSPYSSPVYEASPLNRVLEKYGPGASWRSVVGSGHSVKSAFLANDNTNDSLRCAYYYVTSDNKLVKSSNYDNSQLYVTRIIDEDNHIAFEFKDKLGQVVLTRQINNGFNDTYYVYDDLGNKCFVLPPSVADGLTDKTYIGTEDALTKFAYIYRYDSRNRCIYKKLPGADPIYMIYDKADHLIFSQDGEQRSKMPKEWTFSIPDVFNRTIVTGICTDTISIRNIVLNGSFVSGNNGFMNTGYQLSNQINACTRLLTVDYYDNYDYKSLLTDTIKSKLEYTALDGYAEKYVNAVPEISTKGMLTGTRVFMLEEPAKEIITAMYYDDRGRLAQSKATNHLGGYEKDYFLYTFTGKIKKHQHIHNVPGKTTITEVNENFYDNGERLTKTTHSLNGADPVTLTDNTYDEMGRLSSKKQHEIVGSTIPVETTNYTYNVRSWLKSINTASSRFSEALFYNESSNGSLLCYNGNISAMNWKVQNDTQRGYNFHYDDLNRITAADYQNNDANSNKNYSTSYAYDKMGNIKNLTRNGLSSKPSTFGVIDDLTLNYNGNQLSSVTDASTSEPSYSGAFNFVKASSGTPEYTYDANGNLTRDSHKKIAKIQYNLLNLPSGLQFTEGHTSEYLYDAAGVKRKVKQVTTTENLLVPMGSMLPVPADKVAVTTQTDYCGNVIYENGALSRILVDDGYITMNGTTPTYHYYIQDHQGNNRVVFNQSGTVEQTNHYYPFGMPFGEGIDNSDNRYKYNGKELDRMHGLDLYDYGARMQNGMRFTTIDPLAEKYYSISPYAYCMNNPIRFIDPDGKATGDPNSNKYEFKLPSFSDLVHSTLSSLGLDFQTRPNDNTSKAAKEFISHNKKQAEKKNQIKTNIKKEARNSAGNLEITGTAIQGAGYALAPFSSGLSAVIIPFGKGVELTGTVINSGLDISDGEYAKVITNGTTSIIFNGAGKKLESLEKTRKLAKKESTFLQFVLDANEKIVNGFINKIFDSK